MRSGTKAENNCNECDVVLRVNDTGGRPHSHRGVTPAPTGAHKAPDWFSQLVPRLVYTQTGWNGVVPAGPEVNGVISVIHVDTEQQQLFNVFTF